MPDSTTSLYFAYGANLNVRSMAIRCPAARPVGPAVIMDHGLRFSGVATVIRAEGERVHGALWQLTPACIHALDRFEDWPKLYGKRWVHATDADARESRALLYFLRTPIPPEPPGVGGNTNHRQPRCRT